jgi:hypothetical protein
MRTAIASILVAAAIVLLAVLPAAAAVPVGPDGLAVLPAFKVHHHHHHPKPVHYPNVFIDDEHGVLTTPCVVHAGEALHGIGYVTGTFTITSVTADGPVDLVTLSPAPVPPQSSEVLDFRS